MIGVAQYAEDICFDDLDGRAEYGAYTSAADDGRRRTSAGCSGTTWSRSWCSTAALRSPASERSCCSRSPMPSPPHSASCSGTVAAERSGWGKGSSPAQRWSGSERLWYRRAGRSPDGIFSAGECEDVPEASRRGRGLMQRGQARRTGCPRRPAVGICSRRGVANRGVRGRRRRGLVGVERVGAGGPRPSRGRTMLYDRAGLGRSPPSSLPNRIDREADALRLELDRHGITTPVVLVAHSYGGFVATIVAATDPRIAGVVLVDANLAGFFDDAQIKRLLATYRPQFPALEQAAPELARVMIPVIEAYPATVARLRQVDIRPRRRPSTSSPSARGSRRLRRLRRFAGLIATSSPPRRTGEPSSLAAATTSCATGRRSCSMPSRGSSQPCAREHRRYLAADGGWIGIS